MQMLHTQPGLQGGRMPCRPATMAPPHCRARQQHQAPRRGASVVVRASSDYYGLLGVPRSADKKTIKQAYRQKARKFHPVRQEETAAGRWA